MFAGALDFIDSCGQFATTLNVDSGGIGCGIVQPAPVLVTSDYSGCTWKKCPDNVKEKRKYSVDEKNPRIATKISYGYSYCTIIGNTPVPLNAVVSWSIKILKSKENDGRDIFIGVAPSGIKQNKDNNYNKCGWYFYCGSSTLHSGPPHNYVGKEYGPRKGEGEQYVHTGDSVGVVMDTARSELSFIVNGVNLGVAYEGILLDKPLVPCVLLENFGDSVELEPFGLKEKVVDTSLSHQTLKQRASHGTPSPSNGTLLKVRHSIRLRWRGAESSGHPQQTSSKGKGFFPTLCTTSKCVL